jgi:hypothetical protein
MRREADKGLTAALINQHATRATRRMSPMRQAPQPQFD